MPIIETGDGFEVETEDGVYVLVTEDVITAGCLFTPPIELTVSPLEMDATPLQNRLARWYNVRPRGRAVWHLIDDTFSFDQPYPWFENTANTAAAVGSDNNIVATFKNVYYGGHLYVLPETECDLMAAFLTAQGYNESDWIVHGVSP